MKTLIITDVQNDFMPGGALAVEEGDQILPAINKLQGNSDRRCHAPHQCGCV